MYTLCGRLQLAWLGYLMYHMSSSEWLLYGPFCLLADVSEYVLVPRRVMLPLFSWFGLDRRLVLMSPLSSRYIVHQRWRLSTMSGRFDERSGGDAM